jgi:large subunit ribosomal protein L9e
MKQIRAQKKITIPKGVEVKIDSRRVEVKGPHGTLKRDFRHLPVSIQKINNNKEVEVSIYFGLSKQIATLRTVCSHIDNMIVGTTQKYQYKLRLVYAHFPINAEIANGGKTLHIRNFLGEKVVRTIDMLGDSKITKSDATKDELVIEGTDIDLTSRSAALIHQSCLVKKKDIRKFLDGVYVSQKGAIPRD